MVTGGKAPRMIRVYFVDHHRQLSYLSFDSEEKALRQIRRVHNRLRKITLWYPISGIERHYPAIELMLKNLATQRSPADWL